MKNFSSEINDRLELRTVMEHYGIEFNSRGFAKCPFHSEKTASLSIKNNKFKCFGCGKYGGIIDFVMWTFGITFPQAIIRINSDFNLGLAVNGHQSSKDRRQAAENRRISTAHKVFKESIHKNYLSICALHSVLYRQFANGSSIDGLEELLLNLEEVLNDFTGEEARIWSTN